MLINLADEYPFGFVDLLVDGWSRISAQFGYGSDFKHLKLAEHFANSNNGFS
jgi:hypothetical protein